MSHGFVVTGPPVPCAKCRTPYVPGVVHSTRRKAMPRLCPRCQAQEKKDKRRKKESR